MRQYIRRVVLLVLSGSCAAFLAIGAGGWGLSTVLALVSAEPPNPPPHVLEIPARNWSSDPLAAPLLRNTSRIARELSKTFENDLVRPLRSLARLTDEVLGDVRAVALFIGEHFRQGRVVGLGIALIGNLRGHAAHRQNAAPVAGLDESCGVTGEEMPGHSDLCTLRQHESG